MKTSTGWGLKLGMETGGKSGAILGMALVIVLALSLLGLGLLNLGRMNAVEVSRSYNLNKAFWAAEAGLFNARAKLRGDSTYRAGSFPSVFSNPDFGYTVRVSTPDHVNFGVVSTGVVQGATRVVQMSLRVEEGWPSAFNYSLFSGGQMKLGQNISVTGSGGNGNLYADTGYAGGSKEPVTNNCSIYDGVPGAYPEPTIAHEVPALVTTYYDNLLIQATTSPNIKYPAFLSGIYTVKEDVSITSPMGGSGILVVNGSVSISAGAIIGNGVTIIAKGGLSISSTASLGSNDVFYSAESIQIAKDNTFSAGNSALITPGSIDIQKTFQFAGLIYAGGGIVMDKFTGSAGITGCVVSGGDLTIKKDLNITYDASQLPSPFFPGFNSDVVVTDGIWSQVF
jgi:hypothetical protein